MSRPPWGMDWGNFWGQWSRHGRSGTRPPFFRSGEVRLALLSLLSEHPSHGYGLMRDLEERSGRLYSASAGTVYPVLQQLEDEGLIVGERQEGKTVYTLTEAGRREVEAERERIEAIWERADRWQEWGDVFSAGTVPVALAVSQVVSAAFRAVREDPDLGDRVRDILEQAASTIRSARN